METKTFTTAEILAGAQAHYATGPRPNILQYPCQFVAEYDLVDEDGWVRDESYWVPCVTLNAFGQYDASVEEGSGHIEQLGAFDTFEEACFAAHDWAFDEQQDNAESEEDV